MRVMGWCRAKNRWKFVSVSVAAGGVGGELRRSHKKYCIFLVKTKCNPFNKNVHNKHARSVFLTTVAIRRRRLRRRK